MIVELGGGINPRPDADVVIDLRHPVNALAQDIACGPWQKHGAIVGFTGAKPIRTGEVISGGSVDLVYASHVLEHVSSGEPRLAVFREAHRVLKPGGIFEFLVPLVGWTKGWDPLNRWGGEHLWTHHPAVYADPTHVSAWWFPHSLLYFTGDDRPDEPMNADYGVPAFRSLVDIAVSPWHVGSTWRILDGWIGHACLVKP